MDHANALAESRLPRFERSLTPKSAVTVMNALSIGFRCSIRARQAFVNSTGETRFLRSSFEAFWISILVTSVAAKFLAFIALDISHKDPAADAAAIPRKRLRVRSSQPIGSRRFQVHIYSERSRNRSKLVSLVGHAIVELNHI